MMYEPIYGTTRCFTQVLFQRIIFCVYEPSQISILAYHGSWFTKRLALPLTDPPKLHTKSETQINTPMRRKPLIVTAIPSEVSSVSSTRATPSPTIPVKTSATGTHNACWVRAGGAWEAWPFIVQWACAKQIASSMPSSSSRMQRERRARMAAVTAIEPDVSICTKMATMAQAYTEDRLAGP